MLATSCLHSSVGLRCHPWAFRDRGELSSVAVLVFSWAFDSQARDATVDIPFAWVRLLPGAVNLPECSEMPLRRPMGLACLRKLPGTA